MPKLRKNYESTSLQIFGYLYVNKGHIQWMSLVLDTWIEKNNHFCKWYDLIPLQTLFYFPFCLVEPASVWLFDSGITSLMPISSQDSLRRDMQSRREERAWVASLSVKGHWRADKCPLSILLGALSIHFVFQVRTRYRDISTPFNSSHVGDSSKIILIGTFSFFLHAIQASSQGYIPKAL